MTADQMAADARRVRAALATRRGAECSQVDRWRTALAMALYCGDAAGGERILGEAVAEVPVATVFDQILGAAMQDVGALWERNQISIADEHLATSVAHRLIARLASPRKERIASPRTALLATPESERHTTALLLADHVFRTAGYRTVLLGEGTPVAALRDALARHRPAIVALSSTMPFPAALAAAARAVGESGHRPQLLMGGASAELVADAFEGRRLSGMQELRQVLEREDVGAGSA